MAYIIDFNVADALAEVSKLATKVKGIADDATAASAGLDKVAKATAAVAAASKDSALGAASAKSKLDQLYSKNDQIRHQAQQQVRDQKLLLDTKKRMYDGDMAHVATYKKYLKDLPAIQKKETQEIHNHLKAMDQRAAAEKSIHQKVRQNTAATLNAALRSRQALEKADTAAYNKRLQQLDAIAKAELKAQIAKEQKAKATAAKANDARLKEELAATKAQERAALSLEKAYKKLQTTSDTLHHVMGSKVGELSKNSMVEAGNAAKVLQKKMQELKSIKVGDHNAKSLNNLEKEAKEAAYEVGRLNTALTRSAAPQKQMAASMHLNRQAAAGFRATLTGLGASMGIYTSSTIAVAAVTYGFSRAMKSAITVGRDFEDQMARSNAIMGAGSEGSELLRKKVRQLGEDTVFTATEVAGGMEALAMAGLRPAQALTALYPALQLANIGQIDMYESADILTNVMNGFALSADSIPKIVDDLATAITSSNSTIKQMGLSLAYVAPIAASVGAEIEEVVAILEVFHNAGIKGSRAGTALRRAYANMLKPSKDGKQAIHDLGLQVTDANGRLLQMSDIMQQLSAKGVGAADIIKIFGVRAAPAMQALLRDMGSVNSQFSMFKANLEDNEGASKNLEEQFKDTFGKDLKRLMSAFQEQQISLFEELKSSLRAVIQGTTDWLKSLSPEDIKRFADGLKAVANGLILIAKLASGLIVFKGLSLAMRGVGAASKYTVGQLLGLSGALKAVSAGNAGSFMAASFESKRTAVNIRKLGGASTALSRIMSGVATTFLTVSRFLGPIGVAIGVATTAWALFGSTSKEAAKSLDTLNDAQRTSILLAEEAAQAADRRDKVLTDYVNSGGKAGVDRYQRDLEKEISDLHEKLKAQKSDTRRVKAQAAADESAVTSEELYNLKRLHEAQVAVTKSARERRKAGSQNTTVKDFVAPNVKQYKDQEAAQRAINISLEQEQHLLDLIYEAKQKLDKFTSSGGITPEGRKLIEENIAIMQGLNKDQDFGEGISKGIVDFAQTLSKVDPVTDFARIRDAVRSGSNEVLDEMEKFSAPLQRKIARFYQDNTEKLDKSKSPLEAKGAMLELQEGNAGFSEQLKAISEVGRSASQALDDYIASYNSHAKTLSTGNDILRDRLSLGYQELKVYSDSESAKTRETQASLKAAIAKGKENNIGRERLVVLEANLSALKKEVSVREELLKKESSRKVADDFIKSLEAQINRLPEGRKELQAYITASLQAEEQTLQLSLAERTKAGATDSSTKAIRAEIAAIRDRINVIAELSGKVKDTPKTVRGEAKLSDRAQAVKEYTRSMKELDKLSDSELKDLGTDRETESAEITKRMYEKKYAAAKEYYSQVGSLMSDQLTQVALGQQTWSEAGRAFEETFKAHIIKTLSDSLMGKLFDQIGTGLSTLFDPNALGKGDDGEAASYAADAAKKMALEQGFQASKVAMHQQTLAATTAADIAATQTTNAAAVASTVPAMNSITAAATPAAGATAIATGGSSATMAMVAIPAVFSLLSMLTARQHGGPVSAGMPYIVGERQPELFVPTSDGVILPNVPKGGGGSQGGESAAPQQVVNNHYTINAIDTQSIQSALAKESGFLYGMHEREARSKAVITGRR